jgi:hypothetical protein
MIFYLGVCSKETREGWPLPIDETEANGNPWSTSKRGPSLVGSLGKIFFSSPDTISLHLSPIARQTGQAVVLRRLSLNKCLWIAFLWSP